MKEAIQHRYLVVFLLSLVLTLPFLNRGLFESSEGRYAMVAKTMNETGDYWMPRLNGHQDLTKPQLNYWVIAAGQNFFGHSTEGTRLIYALLWIILTLFMVRMGELLED